MSQVRIETTQFATGIQARMVRVPPQTPAEYIVEALEIPPPRALLILNGGTASLEPQLQELLRRSIGDGLVHAIREEQITVITGATDSGVFALFGQGLSRHGLTAPCIGVTVEGPVTWPDKPHGDVPLEQHHSHFVLVTGDQWGSETQTMYALAAALSTTCPSVAVFAGGGEIVIHEMQANVHQGRTLILVAGSGRTTDAVLAVKAGQPTDDPRLSEIAHSGRIVVFDIRQEPAALHALIRHICFEQVAPS
jgi:hypothetical protein